MLARCSAEHSGEVIGPSADLDGGDMQGPPHHNGLPYLLLVLLLPFRAPLRLTAVTEAESERVVNRLAYVMGSEVLGGDSCFGSPS